jgi:hypothetical protein
MEDILWELPIMERGIDFVDGPDRNIIFANDASLCMGSELERCGRFPDSISGVRVPTWQRYIEAVILLALSSEMSKYSMSGWLHELTYMTSYGDPHRLCHPAFTRFLLAMIRAPTTFRAVLAEALEVLGPRLHNPRAGLTSQQWGYLLGETPE